MVIFVWIAFISLEQRDKLESHRKLCENKHFGNLIMPYEDTKILEFDQYQKSDEGPLTIYTYFE